MIRQVLNIDKYQCHINNLSLGSLNERLDGVAVNNEAYGEIKCENDTKRTAYLDNLKNLVREVGKQRHGKLLTHYSLSWYWGQCDGSNENFTWENSTQDTNHHMIDMFDSIDVQVSFFRKMLKIASRLMTVSVSVNYTTVILMRVNFKISSSIKTIY